MWIWLIAIFVLLAIIFWSRIKVTLNWSREQENDKLFADIRALFGLFRYRFQLPTLDFSRFHKGLIVKSETINKNSAQADSQDQFKINFAKIVKAYRNYKLILESTKGFREWSDRFLSHIHCTSISWKTRVGVGDAAETAISAGIVWAIKTSLLGYLLKSVQLEAQPEIAVQPMYAHSHFSSALTCTLKFQLGYAVIAGLMLLIRILKVKGGIKTWQHILFKA